MKKFALKATVAAAALLASGLSMATVDLDAKTGAANFAKELVNVSGTATNLGGAGALTVNHKIGFGVSKDQNRYLRYNLTNATFGGTVTSASLTFTTGGPHPISVVQGGGIGQDFVIFQVTPGADFLANEVVTLNLDTPKLNVTNKANPILLSYALYGESASDAANENNSVYDEDGTIATFSSGLALSAVKATTTADVSKEFKDFKLNGKNTPDGFISATVAAIGTVTFDKTATLTPAGAPVAITDLVTTGTKLVVTGDLSARGSVDIGTTSCAAISGAGTFPGSSLTNTSADLVTGTSAVASPGLPVCYTNNGTTALPISSYTIAADVVPPTGVERATPPSVALGDIDHDGTTLKFAGVSQPKGNQSWLQLLNTGNIKATGAATCYDNKDNSAPGANNLEVAANSTKRFTLAQVCPNSALNTVHSVQVSLDVPEGSVNGVALRKDTASTITSYVNASAGNK